MNGYDISLATSTELPAFQRSEPPKDGTDIIAIGRVIWSDEFSTTVEPFLLQIRWYKDDSGYEGWHHSDGLTVARVMGDEVKVDYWSRFPSQGGEMSAQSPQQPAELDRLHLVAQLETCALMLLEMERSIDPSSNLLDTSAAIRQRLASLSTYINGGTS